MEIRLNQTAVDRMIDNVAGAALKRATDTTVGRVKSNIVRSGRVRTGTMLNSVRGQRLDDLTSAVFSDVLYSIYQERGTSRGLRGAHFFEEAYKALSTKDFLP